MLHVPTPIGFIIIGLFIVPLLWFGITSYNATSASYQQASEGPDVTAGMSSNEKQTIDRWIVKNNLNEFGDLKGTVYTGGTPLVNEVTGKNIDKYEYIVEKHPDRPWGK